MAPTAEEYAAVPAPRRCDCFQPGHELTSIHARHAARTDPVRSTRVTLVHEDGTISFANGRQLWTHEPERLRAAIAVVGHQARYWTNGVLVVGKKGGRVFWFSGAPEPSPCPTPAASFSAPSAVPAPDSGLERAREANRATPRRELRPRGGCGLYRPGHEVHFIQGRHYFAAASTPATVTSIDDDGTITLGDGTIAWNHDPERLRDALARGTGNVRRGVHGVLAVDMGSARHHLCCLAAGPTSCDRAAYEEGESLADEIVRRGGFLITGREALDRSSRPEGEEQLQAEE